jgi:hypothetical protein
MAAPRWRKRAEQDLREHRGAGDRDPAPGAAQLCDPLAVAFELERARLGPGPERGVDQRREVAHAEQQVPGGHEPRQLVANRDRAERALRDHEAEQDPAEPAELRAAEQ